MTKDIVVGFDGGAAAQLAVEWAVREAELRGSPLRLVTCFDVPFGADPVSGYAFSSALVASGDETRTLVEAAATAVRSAHRDLQVQAEEMSGPPADALLRGREVEDLVVVGAGRHVDSAAFWLGSTPRRLIRHSPCPVAVVRFADGQLHPTDRVVVGVDGSAPSRVALGWAGDEAERLGVELVVVHAWDVAYSAVNEASHRALDITRVDAACVLDGAAQLVRQRCGCTVVERLVRGAAAVALLSEAGPGTLLVVGSRGRGALVSGIFGSTANAVLEHSPVPVVVVPSR